MTRNAGFSLTELMISLAVLVILMSVTGNVFSQSVEGDRQFAAYARDVEECRCVLSSIERDLRQATDVRVGSGHYILTVNGEDLSYRLEDGVLTRSQSGRSLTLARSLAAFDLEREGSLVKVEFRLRRRSKTAAHRKAIITTQVAMRGRKS